MAVFKEYSKGYEKDGYYVHISIPSADHPIPLQTPDEIADFYQSIGYTAGDQIPDQLVWELYELDLHWTGESGISRSGASKLTGESAPSLAQEDVERIQRYVDSYSGEYAEDLEQLVNRIESSTQPEAEPDFDWQEVSERTPPVDFSTVSEEFTEETKRRIQQWLPVSVMTEADRKACEEHLDRKGIDGGGCGKSPHDHLVDLLQTPDYELLLDTHAAHPWTVSSVTIHDESVVDSTNNPSQPILTGKYEVDHFSMENIQSFTVNDLRCYQTSVDIELSVLTTSLESIGVAISDGEIADFTVAPIFKDSGRFDSDAISEFAEEITDTSANSVTHSLAITFAHLLPEMLEYCTAIPDYEMASTDPNVDHFDLPF